MFLINNGPAEPWVDNKKIGLCEIRIKRHKDYDKHFNVKPFVIVSLRNNCWTNNLFLFSNPSTNFYIVIVPNMQPIKRILNFQFS